MSLLDRLAEQQISQAQARGALCNLSGEGKPLPKDDLDAVPAELRAGYRLLRNAGYLPPELLQLRELRSVEGFLAQACDATAPALRQRANWLRLQLGEGRGTRVAALLEQRP